MRSLFSFVGTLALSAAFSVSVLAEQAAPAVEQAQVPAPVAANILSRLRSGREGLSYGEVELSPMPGLYQVQVENGPLLYVSADGNYFLTGTLYGVVPGGFVDMQDLALLPKRRDAMASIAAKDMVTFAAKGETKASIYVFTDIDCGYCRKLHNEVPAMNAKGIEVNYLGYPRAGLNSLSHAKLVGVMCADDPRDALTKMKNNPGLKLPTCENNSVAEQFILGGKLGVRGTPAIVLTDGSLLPGYLTAADLAKQLGI
jgi:thiol:disulfide interchange protein DsbC